MIVKFEIFSKNMALRKKTEVETDAIPRIGETLWMEMNDMDDDVSYLVHDVIYYVGEHNLTPVVRCHEATPTAHRKIVLEEHGWL